MGRARWRMPVVLAGLLLLGSWIFPPWRDSSPRSFDFVLSPPAGKSVQIDTGRLVLIDMAILGAAALWVFISQTRRPSQRGATTDRNSGNTPGGVISSVCSSATTSRQWADLELLETTTIKMSRTWLHSKRNVCAVLLATLPGALYSLESVSGLRFSGEYIAALAGAAAVSVALPGLLVAYGVRTWRQRGLGGVALVLGFLVALSFALMPLTGDNQARGRYPFTGRPFNMRRAG